LTPRLGFIKVRHAKPRSANLLSWVHESRFASHQEKESELANREQRKNELTTLLASQDGRHQLTQLLRECMNLPAGQLPVGTPFVETILEHEFKNLPAEDIAITPGA
jgi:hypothetical protein